MTREERENAIRCLKLWIEREPQLQTYKTCLEALEQEPMRNATPEERESVDAYIKSISKPTGIEFDEEPNGDNVSRQAVLDYIHRILNQGTGKKKSFEFIQKYVEKLPSVKPQEKMGHWNFIGDQMFECSECKHIFTQRQLESWRTYTYESEFPNYCPNCGARMESEKNE